MLSVHYVKCIPLCVCVHSTLCVCVSSGRINFVTADGKVFSHPLYHLGKSLQVGVQLITVAMTTLPYMHCTGFSSYLASVLFSAGNVGLFGTSRRVLGRYCDSVVYSVSCRTCHCWQ